MASTWPLTLIIFLSFLFFSPVETQLPKETCAYDLVDQTASLLNLTNLVGYIFPYWERAMCSQHWHRIGLYKSLTCKGALKLSTSGNAVATGNQPKRWELETYLDAQIIPDLSQNGNNFYPTGFVQVTRDSTLLNSLFAYTMR